MASNQIPDNYDKVVSLLEDAIDGATTHGAAIGLKQNDAAALQQASDALAGKAAGPGGIPPAVKGARTKWNEAKEAKTALRSALSLARSNGRALLSACINVLKPRLGNQWNNAWQAVGFTDASIAIPADPLAKLAQVRAYFESNPTFEKTNVGAGLDATAAACEAAVQAISAAQTASNQADADASAAKTDYQTASDNARSRLIGLRNELTQLLEADDPLWYAFGFDKPSDPDTPEVPAGLVVTPGAAGSHTLFVDWGDARRADTYRATVLKAADGGKLTEQLVSESECTFTDLTTGQQVKVVVSARNSKGGESGATDPAVATVP